tara:strand:+ start:56145 stop:56573 length:429 start_codon:yes stop_codon:yes gene_type:complete
MKVAIGNDHAGTILKNKIVYFLSMKNIVVINHGSDSTESVDYPDFVHPVVNDIIKSKVNFGILLCGTANGVAMTANKEKNIRAGVCWNKEIASLIRKHNNANILCIPARFISTEILLEIVETFLNTEFEGGRHQRRINKINN